MVPFRGNFLLTVLVIALFAMIVMVNADSKDASVEPSEKTQPKSIRSSSRPLRPVRASPTAQQRSTVHHSAASGHQTSTVTTTPVPVASKTSNEEPEYEQQVLVVKGNPTGEKLNEEIRKAIRALLGPEQSDQVQIRELKSEEELRRVAPGARPIGVRLVQ